jgi:acetyl-CoA carboxylase carboxyltransferase component
MRAFIYFIIILGSICMAASGSLAAKIYMWTDEDGQMHITDEPPANGGTVRDVIEYEPGSSSRPAAPSRQSEAVETENKDKEARCRKVYAARRTLRKKREMATAVHRREEEARDKVKDLRERIGFDDDRRDDFKDDLKRLKEKARRAKLFAKQADLDVEVAELQLELAETKVEGECPENY